MNTAAAIIDALNARATPSGGLRAAARESWSQWIDRLGQRPGRVTGAPAADLVAHMAARGAPPSPPRAVDLNRWQAFATLWRQNWQPASRDERSWRIVSGSASFAWHLFVVLLLLIVTAIQLERLPPPADDAVQIEYVGVGTPAEEGGGPAPSAAAKASEQSPAQAARQASSAPAAPASTPQSAATASSQPAAVVQPLTVSKAAPDEAAFKLPPTTLPEQRVQTLPSATPDVAVLPIPQTPLAPAFNAPAPSIDVQAMSAPAPTVSVRAVPQPVAMPATSAQVAVAVDVPRAAAQTVDVQARQIPAASASTPSTSTASSQTSAAPHASAANPTATAAAGPSTATPSSGVGTGPKATPAPGSWATPKRGDDWGVSSRDHPGNGAFDRDGRPNVGTGPGSASAGYPPGMITDEIKDLDRSGTWLKRKPSPYEPTRWDRLWKPNQTLLDDWVDKGVKQVGIPIPGTNKRIVCVISILQLGGGCDISDPDLNEQPARARPSPPVPFKPQLQEGNGATWDKDGKAPPPPKLPGMFAPPKSGTASGG